MSGSSELKTLAALGLVFVDRVVTHGLSKLDGVVSEVCLGSKMILRWSYRNSVASSGRSSSLEWRQWWSSEPPARRPWASRVKNVMNPLATSPSSSRSLPRWTTSSHRSMW